jgi:hypothetical protein
MLRKLGKMLSNVAIIISDFEVQVVDYGDGKVVGAVSNWNFAV